MPINWSYTASFEMRLAQRVKIEPIRIDLCHVPVLNSVPISSDHKSQTRIRDGKIAVWVPCDLFAWPISQNQKNVFVVEIFIENFNFNQHF